MRTTYKSVLRAKGIKPIRRQAHTVKGDGDLELLPVAGLHTHRIEERPSAKVFDLEIIRERCS